MPYITASKAFSDNFLLAAPAQAVVDFVLILNVEIYCFPRMPNWNMYEQTPQGLPRTNNAVEGWHCSLQASLKREQTLLQVHIAQACAGHQPELRC